MNSLKGIIAKHGGIDVAVETAHQDNFYESPLYVALYEHYLSSGEMPVGIAKWRDGDPDQWIINRLCAIQ